jgi:hypothetical protein
MNRQSKLTKSLIFVPGSCNFLCIFLENFFLTQLLSGRRKRCIRRKSNCAVEAISYKPISAKEIKVMLDSSS